MEYLLLTLSIVLIIIGIIGCLVPVLPGPPLSFGGILILHFTPFAEYSRNLLIILGVVAGIVTILDYFVPIWGTKKFGGSKYGVRGSLIGLLVGLLFLGPLGIVLGPFLGALLGELLFDSSDFKRALKAAFGSFVGFLFSTGLKLGVSLVFGYLYWNEFWEHKDLFF